MPKQVKSRSRGNCCLPYDHLLVNDRKDHYPINSADQARNALSRVSQHSSVPPWFKGTLSSLKNIVRKKVKAKYPSIEVSTKKKKSSNERLETLAKIADLNVIEWDYALPELDLAISDKIVCFSNLKIRYVKKFKVIYFRFKINDNEYIIEFPPVESDAEFDAYKYNANNVAYDLIFNHGLVNITVESALPILKKIIFETINSGQENNQILTINFNKLDRLKQILEPYKDVGSVQKEIDVKLVETSPQQIDVDKIHDDKLEELLPKCRLCNNDVYRDYLCYAHYQAHQDLNRPIINKKDPYQVGVNSVNNTFTPARPTSFHNPNIKGRTIASIMDVPRLSHNNQTPFAKIASKILKKKSQRWGDIIRGEWWLTDYGSEFADQNVGDVGHEAIALDNLIPKEKLIEELKSYYSDDEEVLNQLDDIYDEEGSCSIINKFDVPVEVVEKVVGSAEKWKEIIDDPRLAFAKYHCAVLVINSSFYAWEVTKETINKISNFLFEESDVTSDSEITVEEASTKRYVSLPIKDFIEIKNPGQLWLLKNQ